MPLSWNEIRARATTFAAEWRDAERERAESQPFWEAFFNVFGVPRRRVASFERRTDRLNAPPPAAEAFRINVAPVFMRTRIDSSLFFSYDPENLLRKRFRLCQTSLQQH